jgi:hypothetical protein
VEDRGFGGGARARGHTVTVEADSARTTSTGTSNCFIQRPRSQRPRVTVGSIGMDETSPGGSLWLSHQKNHTLSGRSTVSNALDKIRKFFFPRRQWSMATGCRDLTGRRRRRAQSHASNSLPVSRGPPLSQWTPRHRLGPANRKRTGCSPGPRVRQLGDQDGRGVRNRVGSAPGLFCAESRPLLKFATGLHASGSWW